MAKRLEPLAARQKAVAALTTVLLQSKDAKMNTEGEAKFPRAAAQKAAETTAKAADAVKVAADPRG